MLKHNSYITWIIIGVIIYYVFILIYFYRTEFQYMLRSRKKKLEAEPENSATVPVAVTSNDQPYNITEAQDEEDSLEAEDLEYRLTQTISEIAKRDYLVTEFLQLLRMIIGEYPRLKNSPFRKDITELLVSECGKHDKLHITEQEADDLWD